MKFIKKEEGQGLVEYALILVLVAVVVIGALILLGPQIKAAYSQIIVALGGAGLYDYQFQGSPSIKRNSIGVGQCRLTAQNLAIVVTEAGVPVDGLAVTANISISGVGAGAYSGSTNSSGVISWSGQFEDVGYTCGSIVGPAAITISGGVLTASAPVH